MKTVILFITFILLLTGCYGSTTFSNRSVVYQVTPNMRGEHSQVNGSPTASDATVNAEKTYETSTKANVAQNLNDTSSNDQHKEAKATEKEEQK